MDSFRVKLLLISMVGCTSIAIFSFLSVAYFGSFVSKAEYNKDKVEIAIIRTELKHLRAGQEEIKKMIRRH